MSTLLVLSNMSRQNEVLALYASGVGTVRLASTFVAVVATISTMSFLIFDPLVPTFNRRLELIKQGIAPELHENYFTQTGSFWYRSGNLVYNVGRFVPETNTLEDLNVYVLTPSFDLLERIHAKTAKWTNNDWVLETGLVIAYPLDTHFPLGKTFKTKRGIIPEKPTDFRTLKVQEETMRLKDLRRYITRNQAYGLDTTAQQVHYHERLALVFTPLIFVLLGMPFALKPLKTQSMPKSIAFCFLIVFIYLIMFRFTLSIGKGGHIPAIIAGWAPNVIFSAVALLLLGRKT
jgi:lipopolysaccharide export system permease protein